MSKYRFKTEQEFKDEGNWNKNHPSGWNTIGAMNHFLGQEIPEEYNSYCDSNSTFQYEDWYFKENNYILINKVVPGKWYKVAPDSFRKTLNVYTNTVDYCESINHKQYNNTYQPLICYDLSRFVLATQEELNKYLPYDHIDITSDGLDKEFIVGKWYKYITHYIKYLSYEKGFWRASEYISEDGKHHSFSANFGKKESDCKKILLEDLSEIQEYLPEGHSDKIVMEENYTGRTIKALVNNPQSTGVLLGEKIKINRVNETTKNGYILDKTSTDCTGMRIAKPLNLLEWELLPEIFNDIDDIIEQAKLKYPIGCKYICAANTSPNSKVLQKDELTYSSDDDKKIYAHTGGGCLYKNGVWAKLVEEETLISEYIPEYVKCVEGYGYAIKDTIYSTNDEKLADKLFSLSWYAVLIDCKHLGKRFVPYYGDPVLAVNYLFRSDSYENKKETKETPSIKTKKENKTSIEFVQSVAVNLRTKNKSIKF